MNQFLKPFWVYLTTTLPCAVLVYLFGSSFQVIRTLLSKDNKTAWLLFGAALVAMTVAFSGYALFKQITRKPLNPLLGIFVLIGHIAFIYTFLLNDGKVIPFNVPRWMLYEGDLTLYVCTFLMPGIAYGLLLLMLKYTPDGPRYKKLPNIIPIALIPAFWYLYSHSLLPILTKHISSEIFMHGMLVLFITTTLLFLFFLLRLVYLMATGWSWKSPVATMALQALFLLILPVACFIVNHRLSSHSLTGGIFGNFNYPFFYAFAAVNGLLLMAPTPKTTAVRALLFCGRSMAYPLVVYFFFVMLPFFPLSVAALLAFGFGFLMLTPLIVMVIATDAVFKDFRHLSRRFGRGLAALLFFAGFLIAPGYLLYSFTEDKKNLGDALDYIYAPDYADLSAEKLKIPRIVNTLETIKSNKALSGRNPGGRMPYISPFFDWYVLDNLTLSDRKLKTLDMIFSGTSTARPRSTGQTMVQVDSLSIPKITRTAVSEESDTTGQSTWVHCEITNGPTPSTEFATVFPIPEGCWITDFYLEINGKREYGILAEKKTAAWVYQQITTIERRDPGLLTYVDGKNRIQLRVFPFAASETRKIGFRIDHRGPFSFVIDSSRISSLLPERTSADSAVEEKGLGFVVPPDAKRQLPLVKREPYYHFIVDCSKNAAIDGSVLVNRIDSQLKKQPLSGITPVVTLMNYRGKTVEYRAVREALASYPREGGFFLEKALKSIILEAYKRQENRYPVPIVVTGNIDQAIMPGELFAFVGLVPELDRYYVLEEKSGLSARVIAEPSIAYTRSDSAAQSVPVRVWTNNRGDTFHVADDSSISLLPVAQPALSLQPASRDRWSDGLRLCLYERNSELFPDATDEKWISIVKGSFSSRILTHQTSFIALENEAQKQALFKKQKTVLNAKKALDIGEEDRMTEPPFWLLAGGALFLLFVFRRKRSNR